MARAVNPDTGQVFELRNGQWVEVAKQDTGPATPSAQAPRERISTAGDAPGVLDYLQGIGNPYKAATNTLQALASTELGGALMAGAGSTLDTWGRNARDLYAMARGDKAARLAIEDERDEAAGITRRLREENPYVAAAGQMLPALATMPLGMGIGGARLAGALPALGEQLAYGAVQSALGSQSGNFGEDVGVGAAWGITGALAGNMVNRVVAGRAAAAEAREATAAARLSGQLSEAEGDALQAAQRSGMMTTAGQREGSRQARQIEDGLRNNPWFSGEFLKIEEHNVKQLNTLAARAMGVNADNVGQNVLAQAEDQIGQQFTAIGNALGEVPTAKLQKTLEHLAAEESTKILPTSEAWDLLNRFRRGAEGRAQAVAGQAIDTVPGSAIMEFRSEVSAEMRAAFRSQSATGPARGQALLNVLNAVDETIETAAQKAGNPQVLQTYDQARKQWTVLQAIDRNGAASIDGNVFAPAVSRNIRQADKTGFRGFMREQGLSDTGEALMGSTRQVGTGRLGENPIGDFYDALRWRASSLGKPYSPNTGGTTGVFNTLMQGGGLTGATVKAVQRATASPLMRAYSNMSPEAAAAIRASLQGAGGARLTSGGAQLGRAGEQSAAQAWGWPDADK